MSAIKNICAKEKLNFRGDSTFEIIVELESGHSGVFSIPFNLGGDGVKRENDILDRIKIVNEIVIEKIKGIDARDQQRLDKIILSMGEDNSKLALGKVETMAISMAIARAAADYCDMLVYRYIGGANIKSIPKPLSTVLRGGICFDNNLIIKEYMLVPVGFETFIDSLNASIEVFNKMGEILGARGIYSNIQNDHITKIDGDEEALELICDAIDECGYVSGDHFFIALNIAASDWETDEGKYILPNTNKRLMSDQLVEYLFGLCQKYPIISLEDPLGSIDIDGYVELTSKITDVQIAGNSLFSASWRKLQMGIYKHIADALVINITDIGTLSEFMNLVEFSKQAGYTVIMSDRGIDKDNGLIADIALGLGINQVKMGTPNRTQELCKCRRFLEQERYLLDGRVVPISYWKYDW